MEIFLMLALGIWLMVSAMGVVLAKEGVYSALMLTANLIGVGVLYLALGSPYLAAAQVLVYAGAVMVVFLFAITVLGSDKEEESKEGRSSWINLAGYSASGLLGLLLTWLMVQSFGSRSSVTPIPSETSDFARQLFGKYLLPFELTSLLLLVALIAVVLLALPPNKEDSDHE